MGRKGCVLPHYSLPFPLPVLQVSQGEPWEKIDAFTSQPTQRQA